MTTIKNLLTSILGPRGSSRLRVRKSQQLAGRSYETLEPKRLLAVTQIVGSTLEVFGTDVSETLSVREVGGNLAVFSRTPSSVGDIGSFPQSSVTDILFIGAGGNDQIVNRTALPSRIFGGDGNDVLVGGTGDDVIAGQAGNDRLTGDFGRTSDGGQDRLFGNDGRDVLFGGANDDLLSGQAGNDQLRGGRGDDRLIGGDGNDYLNGDANNDTLNGNAGNDLLDGGSGTNVVFGDSGSDLFLSGNSNGSSNRLVGGIGNDRYRFSGDGNGLFAGTDTIVEEPGQGRNDRLEVSDVEGVVAITLDESTILRFGRRFVEQAFPGNIEAPAPPPFFAEILPGLTNSVAVTNPNGVGLTAAQGLTSVTFNLNSFSNITNFVRNVNVTLFGSDITIQRGVPDRFLPNTTTIFEIDFDRNSTRLRQAIGLGRFSDFPQITSVTFGAGVFVDTSGDRIPSQTVETDS